MTTYQETPVRVPYEFRRDAFFFTPANHEAVRSNLRRGVLRFPDSGMNSDRTLSVIMVTMVATVILWAFQVHVWIVVLMAITGVAVTLRLVKADQRQRTQALMERARAEGFIMPGEVVHCVAWAGRSGSIGSGGDFVINVKYLFSAPDEKVLTSDRTGSRNDLSGQPLPVPGTPIYVLYFNKHEFYLL